MRTKPRATKRILKALMLVVTALLLPVGARAADGVLKDDAYTQSSTPNQNFGGNANLRIASGINSYLKFELSALPPSTLGSDVAKATLRVWVNTLTTAGSFDVHRVSGTWDEGTITNNSAPSLGGIEATGITVLAGSVDSFVTVDLTTLVRNWIGGVTTNNGIALLPNVTGINVRFDSKENGATSHEPRLEITLKGLAAVSHDGTLIGDGTTSNPLGVVSQGIGNAQLADGAVSSAKIAAAQVVKSLNAIKDDVNLAAGSNVTITPSGNTLTIAAAGGLTGVSHNTTLVGDGTGSSPLSVAVPLELSASHANPVLSVTNNSGAAIAAVGSVTVTGDINTTTQYSIGGNRILSIPGSSNIFAGIDAGVSNTTGGSNSFFGRSAGRFNTAGQNNSFFGGFAGTNNTTGTENSFFGSGAGVLNTTGKENSFFGSFAGSFNGTGKENAFFGFAAGETTQTGNSNSFFGAYAGQRNVSGFANSFFGRLAGHDTEGNNNAFFGEGAGSANVLGSNNAFFGSNAGISNISGSSNTFIGALSNGVAEVTNATAIGANAVVTQSNSVVLGNNASVGIGTSAPSEKLDVVGSIRIGGSGNGIKFPDGTVQTTAASGASSTATNLNCSGCVSISELDFDPATQPELDAHKTSNDHDARYALSAHTHDVNQVTNAASLMSGNTFTGDQIINGNVGIATNNPVQKLQVNGNIRLGDQSSSFSLLINPGSGAGDLTIGARESAYGQIKANGNEGIFFESTMLNPVLGDPSAGYGAMRFITPDSTGSPLERIKIGGGQNPATIAFVNSKVGIGTTSPVERFEVAGNLKISGSGNGLSFPDGTTQTTAAVNPTAFARLNGGNSFTGDQLISGSVTATSFAGEGSSLTNVNAATLGGQPASAFGTIKTVNAGSGLSGGGTSGDVTLSLNTAFTDSRYASLGSNLFTGNQIINGNVGIGTANPSERLDVEGVARVNYLTVDPQNDTTEGGELQLKGAGPFNSWQLDNVAGNFRLHSAGSSRFELTPTGNVGIGTSAPLTRLHIVGAEPVAGTIAKFERGGSEKDFYIRPLGNERVQLDSAGSFSFGVNATDSTVGAEVLKLTSGGSVGIGTTAPDAKLHVRDSDASGGVSTIHLDGAKTAGVALDLQPTAPGGKRWFIQASANTAGQGARKFIVGSDTNFQVIVADENANVGIGTSNPTAKLHVNGDFVATGTKSAVVALPNNKLVRLYAVESPENWFEDFGSARLTAGVGNVALDPTFAQTVNTEFDYHVFLTPNGDSRGLYVARKTAAEFEVREQGGGKSNVSFDYRVVARRKGYETVRLQELSSAEAALNTSSRRDR